MNRRKPVIFSLLIGAWLVIFFWQRAEHARVQDQLRAGLADRAKVMSSTMDIMLRAMRQFGGAVHDARLQIYLDELVRSKELLGVALVNRSQEVIAESGEVDGLDLETLDELGETWSDDRVCFLHSVDLGISTFGETPRPREAFLLPPPIETSPLLAEELSEGQSRLNRTREDLNRELDSLGAARNTNGTNVVSAERRSRRWPWRGPSMSEERLAELREKYGVHGAVFQLSTGQVVMAIKQDWWQRALIVLFGLLATMAAGVAWLNVRNSEEIRMRLLRSSQQNQHLAEMNMAAAGLAHETRNPLNLIRGMAQMITRDDAANDAVRERCSDMIAEVDRVTGQLNEFINFSRPPELLPTRVGLASVVTDVLRPLSGELEDSGVTVRLALGEFRVEADEKMLRQIVFNLLINSVQAMKSGGVIEVSATAVGDQVVLSVADDGPGVPPAIRDKIFEPYFTTREKEGTGLGLAIIRQIVLAHGWDVEFQSNTPTGALFRVKGMRRVVA